MNRRSLFKAFAGLAAAPKAAEIVAVTPENAGRYLVADPTHTHITTSTSITLKDGKLLWPEQEELLTRIRARPRRNFKITGL